MKLNTISSQENVERFVMRGPIVPSLFTPDMAATLQFYKTTLGFEQSGEWIHEDRLTWMELRRGDTHIWFFGNPITGHNKPVLSGLIYIMIENVDAMAAELGGHVKFEWGPETQDYGLRELGIKDNNGYYLVFAQESG